MATRKPLVIVAGQIEQLQSGDTLSGPFAEIEGLSQTSGEAGGITIGMAVYSSAIDTVKMGKANALSTSELIGVATSTFVITGAGTVQSSGVIALTTGQWDTVAGTTGGLAYGVVYYLDPASSGKITSTAPITVGQVVMRIGHAISTTELIIDLGIPILL
jgi:hypothetical protein